ncbi:MAG TPA: LodA/GoxA family CTQ-dependent oxidase [Pyrinomonadaceae bacterium]|nr:LodA/GoxA family CTQ-dependent oxidase [Pyrinomonadaceae bacterium]
MNFKIHPAIGIARVGDSPDGFYLAPEQVGQLPMELTSDGKEQPIKTFKDSQQRVKRQAARFRVYGYEDGSDEGKELQVGSPIKVVNQRNGMVMEGQVLDIEWTVYLANKKASWYEFKQLDGEHGYDPTHPLRNASITAPDARQQLIIDPGPQTVSYTNKKQRTAQFANGQNPGYSQSFPPPLTPMSIDTLGEIRAIQQDKNIRLLVFGGFGNSGSFNTGFGNPVITDYANNDGWFDDVSDGPVTARVKFKVLKEDGRDPSPNTPPTQFVPVQVPAWVIVGYPRYAPQITDIITMDEIVYDVAVRNFGYEPYIYGTTPFGAGQTPPDPENEKALNVWRETSQWNPDYYPYFYRDIWPILIRPNQYQFVMDFDPFTGGDPHNTTAGGGGNLDEAVLSVPPYEGEDPQERESRRRSRMFVFGILRKAGQENIWFYPYDPDMPKYLPILMPFLCGDNPLSNTVPSKFLRLTDTQLFSLGQWARGKFINEKNEGIPITNPEQSALTGTDLDRGVLSNLLGGSFCPGGEATWIVRNPAIYAGPYRIKHSSYFSPKNLQSWNPQPLSLPGQLVTPDDAGSMKVGLEPGDLTKYSGVPWQADFNECSNQPIDITYEQWNLIYPQNTGDLVADVNQTTYWWPSHRPMEVFTSTGQASWSQGIPNNHAGDLKMVTAWKDLGFISDIGQTPGNFVQSERNDPKI